MSRSSSARVLWKQPVLQPCLDENRFGKKVVLPGDMVVCPRCGGEHEVEISVLGAAALLAYDCGSTRVVASGVLPLTVFAVKPADGGTKI